MLKGLIDLFTFKEIVNILIRSIGYAYGYIVPDKLGCNVIVSIVISLVVGTIFSTAVDMIFKGTKKLTTKKKIIIFISAYIVYLLFWVLADNFLNYDLDNDVIFDVQISVVLYLFGIIVNVIKKVTKKEVKTK